MNNIDYHEGCTIAGDLDMVCGCDNLAIMTNIDMRMNCFDATCPCCGTIMKDVGIFYTGGVKSPEERIDLTIKKTASGNMVEKWTGSHYIPFVAKRFDKK